MARDIEYATKEINHVAGELVVRISACAEADAEGGLISCSYSNKSMAVARGEGSVDLPPLKIPLLLQILSLHPDAALDPALPLHPVLDPNPVLPLWILQSLPIVLCMKAGRLSADRALAR